MGRYKEKLRESHIKNPGIPNTPKKEIKEILEIQKFINMRH